MKIGLGKKKCVLCGEGYIPGMTLSGSVNLLWVGRQFYARRQRIYNLCWLGRDPHLQNHWGGTQTEVGHRKRLGEVQEEPEKKQIKKGEKETEKKIKKDGKGKKMKRIQNEKKEEKKIIIKTGKKKEKKDKKQEKK